MSEIETTLPIGTVLGGRYTILKILGRGGFGAVYLVRDEHVRYPGASLFALKEIVEPSQRERHRFAFESLVLRQLDHPSFPRVHHAFTDDEHDRVYMLMDYIEGANLEVLRQQQPEKRFAWPRVKAMMSPIIDALKYLHTRSVPIVHRDIKPANIILSSVTHTTTLVDFGIAKEYEPEGTTSSVRYFSPGYAAPEQYSKGTDRRTDIYGLGATFYTLLTGIVPPDALHRLTLLSNDEPDPLLPLSLLVPMLPPPVCEAVQRAMSIKAQNRFESVEQFWEAINAPLSERHTPLPVSWPYSPPAPPPVPLPAVVQQKILPDERRKVRKKSSLFFSRFLIFAIIPLLILLLALVVSVGPGIHLLSHPDSTVVIRPTAPPAITPSPTSSDTGAFLNIQGSYHGTINDLSTNTRTDMSLIVARQDQGKISGNFSGLQTGGPFKGSIDLAEKITFTVMDTEERILFIFNGNVQTAKSLSGTFYRCQTPVLQADACRKSSYGNWNTVLIEA